MKCFFTPIASWQSTSFSNFISCFLVRYWLLPVLGLLLSLGASAQAPTNDDCAGAILLEVNQDLTYNKKYSGTTGVATQSLPNCRVASYEAKDVWFKFVATASTHNINLSPISYDDYVFEVFSGSCGALTSLACVGNTLANEKEVAVVKNLVPGNTYYIRVYHIIGISSVNQKFTIAINENTATILNDECIGALEIIPGGSSYEDRYTNVGATPTASMPACIGTVNNDIWFKFTATATRSRIIASSESGDIPNRIGMEAFSGSCGSLTTIACNQTLDHMLDLRGLVPGQTYYYRLYFKNGSSQRTDFLTYIRVVPEPPANDECIGALNVPVNSGTGTTLKLSGNLHYQTASAPLQCKTLTYSFTDGWYKFTATAAVHKITVKPTIYQDYIFEVFDGSCGNLNLLTCSDNAFSNEEEVSLVKNLVPGNTYYMRVYSRNGASDGNTFDIIINESETTVPNDECSGAAEISPDDLNTKGYTNIGATLSRPACVGTASNDIWFKFKATGKRYLLRASSEIGTSRIAIEVFKGSCNSLQSIACSASTAQNIDLRGLTPGETYYYRVYFVDGNALRTTFYTRLITMEDVPVNDECSGALTLPVNRGDSTQLTFNGVVGPATESRPSCKYTGLPANDVWYKFNATSATHRITLNPRNYEDYIFEVLEGDCGALRSVACLDATESDEIESLALKNLAIGSTYYVRVYSKHSSASNNVVFTLTVNESSRSVQNDECSGAFHLQPVTSPPYIRYTNTNASLSMPACDGGYAYSDIWFSFNAESARQRIHFGSLNGQASVYMQLFSGECGNLTPVYCYSFSAGTADIKGLIAGQKYYYRLYLNNSYKQTDFTTYVTTPVPLPGIPKLSSSTYCVEDTLRIAVSGITAGNGVRGFADTIPLMYDEQNKRFSLKADTPGTYIIRTVQINTEGDVSDTAAITVTVLPRVYASVTINASALEICAGTTVNFSATAQNEGLQPRYIWLQNGQTVGTSTSLTLNQLKNGDKVSVALISNATCVSDSTVSSDTLQLTVLQNIVPKGNIDAPSSICVQENFNIQITLDRSMSPIGSEAELFEINGSGANAGLGKKTYTGDPMHWIIQHNEQPGSKRYYAVLSAPPGTPCNEVTYTDTAIVEVSAYIVPAGTLSVPANTCISEPFHVQADLNDAVSPTGSGAELFEIKGNSPAVSLGKKQYTGAPLVWTIQNNSQPGNKQYYAIFSAPATALCNRTTHSDTISMQVDTLPVPQLHIIQNEIAIILPETAASYSWQKKEPQGWLDLPAAPALKYEARSAGTYRVKGVKGTCVQYSPEAVVDVSIPISLYPNPVSNTFRFGPLLEQGKWETLEITSASNGIIYIRMTNMDARGMISVDVTKLPKGMYLAVLKNSEGKLTTVRFVKQ